jgi:hypothetical protein
MTAPRTKALIAVAWALPCTVLGLVVALPLLLAGGSIRRVGRTLECSLYPHALPEASLLRRIPFSAITLGHVIVGSCGNELRRHRAHERAHVRQYERWGLLFLVAYPLASLTAALGGRSAYLHNRFEIQARREAADEERAA